MKLTRPVSALATLAAAATLTTTGLLAATTSAGHAAAAPAPTTVDASSSAAASGPCPTTVRFVVTHRTGVYYDFDENGLYGLLKYKEVGDYVTGYYLPKYPQYVNVETYASPNYYGFMAARNLSFAGCTGVA